MHEEISKDKCPKCGFNETDTIGNEAECPDIWQRWNCKSCGWLVGEIDNSDYMSCHDFEDFIIEI